MFLGRTPRRTLLASARGTVCAQPLIVKLFADLDGSRAGCSVKSTAGLDRPEGRAAAAMTSSESSGMITPGQVSEGIREEQDVGVTPTRARRSGSVGVLLESGK